MSPMNCTDQDGIRGMLHATERVVSLLWASSGLVDLPTTLQPRLHGIQQNLSLPHANFMVLSVQTRDAQQANWIHQALHGEDSTANSGRLVCLTRFQEYNTSTC